MCHAAPSAGQLELNRNKLRSSSNVVYDLSRLGGQGIRLEGLFMACDFANGRRDDSFLKLTDKRWD